MTQRTNPHDWFEQWESNVAAPAVPSTLVCSQCVTDVDLWSSVEPAAEQGVCNFCHTTNECVTFDDLAEVIVEVLGQYYVTVDESGAYHDDGHWSEQVHDIQDIVDELVQDAVENGVRQPLVNFVSQGNAVEYGFIRTRDLWATLYESHEGEWRRFMRDARSGDIVAAASKLTAALSPKVLDLFGKIETIAVLQRRFNHAQPQLWRCRPGPAEPGYRSGPEIGTAPDGLAADGRLTPEASSAFYGSTTMRGAVIEMAKHHGRDATMWGGRFTPSRPLYHLDVMDVPDVPSVFAPDAADTRDAIDFLARFAETIRQPNDGDTLHYLPTQIFVAYLLARADELRPDAIRYASSLDPQSENWVVFADHDHCVDDHAPDGDDLYMVLDPDTVEFVTASDFQ